MTTDGLALGIFWVALLLNTIAWLAKRNKLRTVEARKWELVRDIAELRREAAKYNAPSTYAKCAKAQRLMTAKEKQLACLESGPSSQTWEDNVQRATHVCKVVAAASLGMWLYGRPLLHLPPEVTSPLHRMLAMPHGAAFSKQGAVAVAPWMLLCNRACQMLAQAAFPATRQHRSVAAIDTKKEL